MGMRLANKVTLITGATLGLGKATALLYASEGASVVICDRGRTPENAHKVLQAASDLDGEIAYQVCDVMQSEDITALVEFAMERYGRIDVLVNNAIIDNPGGLLEDVTLQDWDDGIFCHMTAPLLFCQAVVPIMLKQGGGSIINVSSGTALFGSPSISSYGPAKAAMINFTQNLAVTYGPYGIRANTLTPQRMITEKKREMLANHPAEVRRQQIVYPMGNPPTAEMVAGAMLFLASDDSVAVSGHNLVADRGAAAYNSVSVPGRLEADMRKRLIKQGMTDWLQEEM